jgi:phosphorylcholine metabolism protein LicD
MPWDSDVDVQMSEGSMHYLAKYYNMTMHHFRLPGLDHGRDYLLEVNPHYVNGSTTDRLNVIDARWIDTESGLFIDITTLRVDRTADIKGDVPNMYCKDKHKYLYKDIFPLRDSDFEGAPVKVPYAYSELLEAEYGPKSLTNKQFENHFFDEEQQMWLPNGYVLKCVSYLPSQVTLVRGFLASERSNISICGRSKSNPTGRRTYLSHFRL